MSPPVIVIGAGAASAAACLTLAKAGKRTLVLEAQPRIGGRIQTHDFGFKIDFGASYIHGFEHEHNPVKIMASELGIEHFIATPEPGQFFTFDGKPIDPTVLKEASEAVAAATSKVTSAVRINTAASDTSLGAALSSELGANPLALGLARVGEVGGIPLEAVSSRYYKTEIPLAGVDATPVGGYQAFLDKAFQKAGSEVRLNTPVTGIQRTAEGVKVKTQSGETFASTHVISTVPLTLLQKGAIAFDPALPKERTKVVQRTSVGVLDKILLVYPSVWWPAKAANFLVLPSSTTAADTTSPILQALTSGPLVCPNLHATLKDQPAALLCYVGADRAKALEKYTAEEVGQALHGLLAGIVATEGAKVESPTRFGFTKWGEDPYALGATTGPVPVAGGAEPSDYTTLGEPLWDELLFAGEHTEKDWRGSVAGAMQSGIREAQRILNAHA